MKRAATITRALTKHRFAYLFLNSVDSARGNAPRHPDAVLIPMDLQTVSRRLKENAYLRWEDWESDVDLIFDNCIACHGAESPSGCIARHMKSYFHKLLMPLKSQSYGPWIERSQELYRRIIALSKSSPAIVKKVISSPGFDETLTFSDAELETLALKLSLLERPELLPIMEILGIFGVDVWDAKGKKVVLDLKSLPPPALEVLASYVKEGETKRQK